MPFSVSNPVLYYNRSGVRRRRARPRRPPEVARRGPAVLAADRRLRRGVGLAIDTGVDSGGGWFLEQWFANAGELYADNGNGRLAPATRVLYDGAPASSC